MEIIRSKVTLKNDFRSYFNGHRACMLDIETLGFSRNYHAIYLVGLVYFSEEEDSFLIDQLFIDSLDEEEILLQTLMDFLQDFDLIISYNGQSFDLPFIVERTKKYGLEDRISQKESFDIYREIRKFGKYLELDNLKLKTIEEYLGIYREDSFTGGDCIELYLDYTRTRDLRLKKLVLGHNFEDLYYLTDVLKILDFIAEKNSFSLGQINFKLLDFKLSKSKMKILISSSKELKLKYFSQGFSLESKGPRELSLNLEVIKAQLSPDTICHYFDMDNLEDFLEDSTGYALAENILILTIGKKEVIDNIRNLSQYILKSIIKK